jgi:glutamine amidotransferase PdxT
MPEIGLSGLMSGDGKRGVGQRPEATAPILDSTLADIGPYARELKKRDETLSIIVVIVDGASPAAKMTRLTRMRHSLRLISKSIIAVGQRSFQTCAAFCLLAQQMNGRAIPRTSTPTRARVGC